ncbi:hypothetical protein [Vibrio vulnificus]|uniref:hypothetical protein n=2 Tax=Vibrio vulnificus TaxID=672 RepID=UPI003B007F37
MSFGGESGLQKLGLCGIHPLTQRYVFGGNMSNFRVRLRESVRILCTNEAELKYRLKLAICEELLFANVPEDMSVPLYFQKQHQVIMEIATEKTWSKEVTSDRVGATIYRRHGKTLSKWASMILQLHQEYEEYLVSGFIPEHT